MYGSTITTLFLLLSSFISFTSGRKVCKHRIFKCHDYPSLDPGHNVPAPYDAVDDCSNGPFDERQTWGHAGGAEYFCDMRWKSGLVVTGIEVWANSSQVNGVQLTFSDTSVGLLHGTANGDRHDSISWGPDETLKMKLSGNMFDTALGLVHVEVAGKTLDVRSDTHGFDGDDVEIGSGILLGAAGEQGDSVTSWTPLFLGRTTGEANVVSIQIDDHIADFNKDQTKVESTTVRSVYVCNSNPLNSTNNDESWEFNGEVTETSSQSFSNTKEKVFSLSESIELSSTFGIPEVADVGVSSTSSFGFQWSYGQTSTDTKQWETQIGQKQGSTDYSDLLKPGHCKFCTTQAVSGSYDAGYTSIVEVTVGGKPYQLQRRGQFLGTTWASGTSDCKDVLRQDVPNGSNITNSLGDIRAKPRGIHTKRAVGFRA